MNCDKVQSRWLLCILQMFSVHFIWLNKHSQTNKCKCHKIVAFFVSLIVKWSSGQTNEANCKSNTKTLRSDAFYSNKLEWQKSEQNNANILSDPVRFSRGYRYCKMCRSGLARFITYSTECCRCGYSLYTQLHVVRTLFSARIQFSFISKTKP